MNPVDLKLQVYGVGAILFHVQGVPNASSEALDDYRVLQASLLYGLALIVQNPDWQGRLDDIRCVRIPGSSTMGLSED